MHEKDLLKERIIELETLWTHQQRLLDELNEALIAQGQEIDRLTGEVKQLQAFLRAQPWRGEGDITNEKPPHY